MTGLKAAAELHIERVARDPTPLWNILDLTPAGRGVDWYAKLDDPAASRNEVASP